MSNFVMAMGLLFSMVGFGSPAAQSNIEDALARLDKAERRLERAFQDVQVVRESLYSALRQMNESPSQYVCTLTIPGFGTTYRETGSSIESARAKAKEKCLNSGQTQAIHCKVFADQEDKWTCYEEDN